MQTDAAEVEHFTGSSDNATPGPGGVKVNRPNLESGGGADDGAGGEEVVFSTRRVGKGQTREGGGDQGMFNRIRGRRRPRRRMRKGRPRPILIDVLYDLNSKLKDNRGRIGSGARARGGGGVGGRRRPVQNLIDFSIQIQLKMKRNSLEEEAQSLERTRLPRPESDWCFIKSIM